MNRPHSKKKKKQRPFLVSCPDADDTVPPEFNVCFGSRKKFTGVYVYFILIDSTGNRYCSGPHKIPETYCVPFIDNDNNIVPDGTYNLLVHFLDDDKGVDCDNVAGHATKLEFIPNLTIEDGADDPCLYHRRPKKRTRKVANSSKKKR